MCICILSFIIVPKTSVHYKNYSGGVHVHVHDIFICPVAFLKRGWLLCEHCRTIVTWIPSILLSYRQQKFGVWSLLQLGKPCIYLQHGQYVSSPSWLLLLLSKKRCILRCEWKASSSLRLRIHRSVVCSLLSHLQLPPWFLPDRCRWTTLWNPLISALRQTRPTREHLQTPIIHESPHLCNRIHHRWKWMIMVIKCSTVRWGYHFREVHSLQQHTKTLLTWPSSNYLRNANESLSARLQLSLCLCLSLWLW